MLDAVHFVGLESVPCLGVLCMSHYVIVSAAKRGGSSRDTVLYVFLYVYVF